MSLTLMYITNNPDMARIAQKAGVDRVWIDMEYIGKEDRQAGMNTVKSHHTVEDIRRLRPLLTSSQLQVRVNPLHQATAAFGGSKEEIDDAIAAGAEIVMLPMFRTRADVEQFVEYVDGRARVQLLVETAEAAQNIDDILQCQGVDEIHIGLNDLHLAYNKTFMFELLCDDMVATLCAKIRKKGIKYGFGGIARVGHGMLPAEHIIAEHYALGSSAAILSRGFCDANLVSDPHEIEDVFIQGVKDIRRKEQEVALFSAQQYEENRAVIREKVAHIVQRIKEQG